MKLGPQLRRDVAAPQEPTFFSCLQAPTLNVMSRQGTTCAKACMILEYSELLQEVCKHFELYRPRRCFNKGWGVGISAFILGFCSFGLFRNGGC